MTEFDAQIQAFGAKLDEELRGGELSFPTAWEASLRIKKLADSNDASLDQLVAVVQAEPVLSAKVVSMANTLGHSSFARPVSNVAAAVRRIGTASLRCLAFSVAAEQLHHDHRSPTVKLIASSLWLHSTDVAAWAYALSRHLKVGQPDNAMFAGVMTTIGQFFLVARVSECPALEADPERFAEFVVQWQEPVGHALLNAFGLPLSVVESIRPQETYTGTFPPAALTDVLAFAALVSDSPNPFITIQPVPRLALADTPGIDGAKLSELLDSVRPAQQQVLAAMRG